MAIVNKTIASSGADYTSLAAFEAAIPADSTDQWIGTVTENYQCNTSSLSLNVSNANNMAHTIDVAEGVRHNRTRGSGARTGGPNITCDVRTPDFVIRNLEMTTTSLGLPPLRIVAGSNDVVIDNCYVWKLSTGTLEPVQTAANDIIIKKTAIVQAATATGACIKAFLGAGPTLSIINCSLLANGGSTGTWDMINTLGQTVIVRNTKCLSDDVNGTTRRSFDTHANMTGDYNVGSDTTAPGVNSVDNEAAGDHYVSITSGSDDESINATLDKPTFYGDDTLAGEFDVDGDELIAGVIDRGCDQQSVAPSGGGGVATSRSGLTLGTGLRL